MDRRNYRNHRANNISLKINLSCIGQKEEYLFDGLISLVST